jgi:hypothetical protein
VPVKTTIQVRRDTAANWAGKVLADGELGYVNDGADKGKFKIGDGSTVWGTLPFAPSGNSDTATTATKASKITASGSDRTLFVSTGTPSGAVTGDIWIQI